MWKLLRISKDILGFFSLDLCLLSETLKECFESVTHRAHPTRELCKTVLWSLSTKTFSSIWRRCETFREHKIEGNLLAATREKVQFSHFLCFHFIHLTNYIRPHVRYESTEASLFFLFCSFAFLAFFTCEGENSIQCVASSVVYPMQRRSLDINHLCIRKSTVVIGNASVVPFKDLQTSC